MKDISQIVRNEGDGTTRNTEAIIRKQLEYLKHKCHYVTKDGICNIHEPCEYTRVEDNIKKCTRYR